MKDNRGAGYGGGLFVNYSSAEISRNVFEGNVAAGQYSSGCGAAILATDDSNRVNMTENDFRENLADYGAAALLDTYYENALSES